MKIVTFCEVDESLFNPEFKVEYFHTTGETSDADIAIINIDSIFEFEENKSKICKEKYVSIAIHFGWFTYSSIITSSNLSIS